MLFWKKSKIIRCIVHSTIPASKMAVIEWTTHLALCLCRAGRVPSRIGRRRMVDGGCRSCSHRAHNPGARTTTYQRALKFRGECTELSKKALGRQAMHLPTEIGEMIQYFSRLPIVTILPFYPQNLCMRFLECSIFCTRFSGRFRRLRI